jgi:phenylpropionate dioxygenase-like ring-hydroxylating dioxygenase large terminal subunit
MYLKNCWYVAVWDSEVGEKPLARTILGEPIVFYRGASGQVAALEDRCCHRNLPLSMGTVEGDSLRCGYHGLKYDAAGACIEVPGQKQVPPDARVKRYPLIARWKMLWIWMGDPARVDEGLMPHWELLEDPRLVLSRGNNEKPLEMRCNWELNNDNLLDLTHVAFVHSNTLGFPDVNFNPIKTVRSQSGVRMSRWTPNTKPTPIFAQYLGLSEGETVDRWQGTDAELPAHCLIHAGFAPSGALSPDDEEGRDKYIRFHAFITATPETPSSSFMFYVQARNFARDNERLTERVVEDFRRVFHEDIAVMEAQQQVNDARPDAPIIDIAVDAPVLAMRRLVHERIAAEAKQ